MSQYIGDVISLETYDGRRQYAPDGGFAIPAYGNFGAPPVQWVTSRGYRQHGATAIDYVIEPRTVTLEVYQAGACTRQQYWDNRARLLEFLRPNRGGPLKLTIRTPNGDRRSIHVRPDPGAVFPPVPATLNNWAVQDVVNLIAHDPFWFDPDSIDLVSEGATDDNLVFPITFPISFGLSGRRFIFDQVYNGTWESFPVFIIDGPYDRVTFINNATNAVFRLLQAIGSGDRRIIDLTPGSQSITDAGGRNRFGELSPDSNLVRFSLQPDPVVENGAQEIEVIVTGASIATRVTIHYTEKYYGM